MENPNNCDLCKHKQHPDGGHCYMFREPPSDVCRWHGLTIRASPTDAFRDLMVYGSGCYRLPSRAFIRFSWMRKKARTGAAYGSAAYASVLWLFEAEWSRWEVR